MYIFIEEDVLSAIFQKIEEDILIFKPLWTKNFDSPQFSSDSIVVLKSTRRIKDSSGIRTLLLSDKNISRLKKTIEKLGKKPLYKFKI